MTVNQTSLSPADALQPAMVRPLPGDAGPARDVNSFETMLKSSLGMFGEIMGNAAKKGSDDTNKDPVKAADAAAGRIAGGSVDGSQVRMKINKDARHPEDLGHLREYASGALSTKGFSKREEDLLLRAAAAETKLTYAGRTFINDIPGAGRAMGAGQARTAGIGKQKTGATATAKAEPQGKLCASYESNGDSGAIGYDSKGGTSYGLYQIASNTGTMDRFMKFLDSKAPDLAKRLAAAGPSNTGSKSGTMPDVWKQIAAEQGERFASLQHEFIRESHYEPAAKSINMVCSMDVGEKSQALREVLWSTAVQHGASGATEIFVTAADNLTSKGKHVQNFDKAMIEEVYRLRSGHFGGHSQRVQAAVQNRLQSEKQTAVAMLEKGKLA